MKRILSLLLALVIAISAAVPAYATGDGNFDGGGGSMGDGTKTNYWNPGMDGVRVSIVDVGSHSVVRTPIDLTNKVPIANIAHFGKVSKLSYNAGRGLSVSVSGYSYRNPSQSLPKIISTGSSKASIAAIRSYFTDEQVIRSIAGYAGMDFDTLIGGDYKLVVEPLAYLCYNGQQFAMTATLCMTSSSTEISERSWVRSPIKICRWRFFWRKRISVTLLGPAAARRRCPTATSSPLLVSASSASTR